MEELSKKEEGLLDMDDSLVTTGEGHGQQCGDLWDMRTE